MDTVRLGQTERGSYVVAIETPVSPELAGQVGLGPEPFARRVTRQLATSLHALLRAAQNQDASEIQQSVASGVSANLCSAMANALGLSVPKGEVEVRVSWARTRRVPPNTPVSVLFPGYLTGVISEAATILRANSEIESFELEGTVYKLRQDTEAIILGLVDGQHGKVRLTIPDHYRDALIRAFERRSIVTCTGELRQTGKIAELLNVRSLDTSEDTSESEAD